MCVCVCVCVCVVPSAAPDNVVVEVMNSSTVKVSWTRVHKDMLHGHLGGYRVNALKHTHTHSHKHTHTHTHTHTGARHLTETDLTFL